VWAEWLRQKGVSGIGSTESRRPNQLLAASPRPAVTDFKATLRLAPGDCPPATVLETRLVIERQIDEAGQAERDRLLAATAITTAPLGETHLHWALVD